MQTKATREFPYALGRIQFGAVRRQEIQSETPGSLPPPVPVQPGMVVFGVVGNHRHSPRLCGY